MMRNIDFHLKYCILEGNLKLTASGRKRARAILERAKKSSLFPFFKHFFCGNSYCFLIPKTVAQEGQRNVREESKGSLTLGRGCPLPL
jgi:hypothetical protein